MKGFQKGISGNPSGKPKGSQNRTTKQAKELIEIVLYAELDNIKDALEKIRVDSDYRYIDSLVKLLAYVLPKRTDLTSGDEQITTQINITVDSQDTADTLLKLKDGGKAN